MKISNLLTNDIKNPIGFRVDILRFSWQYSEMDKTRICSSRFYIWDEFEHKIIYDTGTITGLMDPFHSTSLLLKPRKRYDWCISVVDDKGIEEKETAFFETGKLKEDWKANWITTETENTETMPLLSKEFIVPFQVKRARLYIYAVGLFEVFLNRDKVGDEYLSPGYHSYDLNMETQAYSLDSLAQGRKNRIEILLGEGWYKGRFGFDSDYYNLYGKYKKCIAEIYIEGEKGEELTIFTDDSWLAEESEVGANGIYDGEIINETIEKKLLKTKTCRDSKELLCDRFNLPIKKYRTYDSTDFFMEEDSIVFDFGKILTGWVELEAVFRPGQVVELLYGEVLQDKKFYQDNLRTAKASFTYTAKGGKKKIRPHFTFFGFRYVKISGIKVEEIKELKAYSLMSVIEEIGFVETSDEKVNQLFENTKQSQHCNFLDIPTDCPQRDERMGWTGDVTVFSETANYHMSCGAFFHHYLENLKKEQALLNGSVPFFVPNPKIEPHEQINPFYVSSGAAVWGDVATVLPWNLYKMYGNKEDLEKHFSIMENWVDHITEVAKNNEIPYLWQNERQLGDWLALDNGNIHNPIGLTDPGLIASAYYYHSANLTSKAAKVIGHEREQEFVKLSEHIKTAFLKEFYDEQGALKSEITQTACALLLNLQLYTEDKKEYLVKNLEKAIVENDYHLNTGFVGTYQLLPALSEYGLNDLSYRLLLNEEYPGWLYEVNLGATTVWERWNSLLEDGTISGTEMNSLNHYAYGCVAGWMYKYMCGFQPQMQEEIRMILKPVPNKSITWVKGSWRSIYGEYKIKWEFVKDTLRYEIEIPELSNAKMIFENGKEILLTGGNYIYDRDGNKMK